MQKKIPMRQCIGCREKKPKRELIRVVRPPEGEVTLDFSGKMNGRGAYLRKDPACLKRAAKAKALEHAFETVIPEIVYEKLALQLENENENR